MLNILNSKYQELVKIVVPETYKFLDTETIKILETPLEELKETDFNYINSLYKLYIEVGIKHFTLYVNLKKMCLNSRLGRIAEHYKTTAIAKIPNSKYNTQYSVRYSNIFERAIY